MSGLPELQEGDAEIIEQLRHPLGDRNHPKYNQALLEKLSSVGLITADTAKRVLNHIEEAVHAPRRACNAKFVEKEKQKEKETLQTQLEEAGKLIEAQNYEGMLAMMEKNTCPGVRYLHDEPKKMLVDAIFESNNVDYISKMMKFVHEDDYLALATEIVIQDGTVEQLAQAVIRSSGRIGHCKELVNKFIEVSGNEHFGLCMLILEKLDTVHAEAVVWVLLKRLTSSEEGIACFVEHFKTKEQGSREQSQLIQYAARPGCEAILLRCIDEAHIDTKMLQQNSSIDSLQLIIDVIRTQKRLKPVELSDDLEQKVTQLMDTIASVVVLFKSLDQNEVFADFKKLVAQRDMAELEIYLDSIEEHLNNRADQWRPNYHAVDIDISFTNAMGVLEEIEAMNT